MRKALVCAVAGTALLLQGCTVVKKDLHSAGGYTGSVLDKHMFDASGSKELQVLRAALIVAMVARAGTAYSRPGGEGNAYVDAIVDAVDQINILAGHVVGDGESLACSLPPAGPIPDPPVGEWEAVLRNAQLAENGARMSAIAARDHADRAEAARKALEEKLPEEGVPPPPADEQAPARTDGCATYAVNFESDIPLMERAVFRLTVLALPQDLARSFLGSLKTGNALSAAWNAAKLALAAANGLHSAAAVNRTAREVTAHQVPGAAPKTIKQALDDLGLVEGDIFESPTVSLSRTVDPKSMAAVMRNIRDSCLLVPLNSMTDDAAEAAKNRKEDCMKIKYEPKARFKV